MIYLKQSVFFPGEAVELIMKDFLRHRVFYSELTQSATYVIFFNRPRRDGGACF